MNYGTGNVEVPKLGGSSWIGYGLMKLCIKDVIIKLSSSTGKIQTQFIIETEPNEKVKPVEVEGLLNGKFSTTGKVGIIPLVDFYYLEDDTKNVGECLRDFAIISAEIGVREQMDAIDADTWEDYVKQATTLIKDTWIWVSIRAKEDVNPNSGNVVLRRTFGKYVSKQEDGTYLASIQVIKAEGAIFAKDGDVEKVTKGNKFIQFDPNNKYDLFKLPDTPKPDDNPLEAGASEGDEIPF